MNPPESPVSLPRYEKSQSQGSKSKSKSGKEKGQGYPAGKENREPHPTSQQFDFTMPHWTLRIVSDAFNAVCGTVFKGSLVINVIQQEQCVIICELLSSSFIFSQASVLFLDISLGEVISLRSLCSFFWILLIIKTIF